MRVFMLGWEFPPYITGGLGTACHGLTRAMSRQGMSVTFVLPRPVTPEPGAPARLLSPRAEAPPDQAGASGAHPLGRDPGPGFENVTFHTVPAHLSSPYQTAADRWAAIERQRLAHHQASAHPQSVLHEPRAEADRHGRTLGNPGTPGLAPGEVYQGDLLAEADRYARLCVELARNEAFDVIHAHDWLSFPAAMAVAGATGKPMIAHVHSTELDRAGERIQQPIYDIERRGMHAAVRVITVSHFTRTLIQQRYDIDPDRIDVVYNGIESPPEASPATSPEASVSDHAPRAAPADTPHNGARGEPTVLFLGRVTRQKGPSYFIEAAKKVLEKCERVRFIVTGSGDQMPEVIDMAARCGIGHKVNFTGFLEGDALERVFQRADVYVMPSVSEPFGIAALEAIRHDVPTIVSRTSGVGEALHNVLKVDFWDTNEIADKIIAVLSHAPLARTLRHNADRELDRFTWDDAARRCRRVYEEACAVMPR